MINLFLAVFFGCLTRNSPLFLGTCSQLNGKGPLLVSFSTYLFITAAYCSLLVHHTPTHHPQYRSSLALRFRVVGKRLLEYKINEAGVDHTTFSLLQHFLPNSSRSSRTSSKNKVHDQRQDDEKTKLASTKTPLPLTGCPKPGGGVLSYTILGGKFCCAWYPDRHPVAGLSFLPFPSFAIHPNPIQRLILVNMG